MTKKYWLGGAIALAMVGCGGGSGSIYTTQSNAEKQAIAAACECYATLTYPSEAECVAGLSDSNTPEQEACIKAIVDAHAAELREAANCRAGVFNAGHDCIRQVVACDEAALQACFDSVDASLMDCPEPSAAIQAEIQGCF